MKPRCTVVLVLSLWASLMPAIATAHSMSAALLRLEPRADGTMDVLLKIPRVESGPASLRVRLPDRCRRLGDRTIRQTANAILESWRILCTPTDLLGGRIAVDGLNPAVGELFIDLESREHAPWTGVLTRDASTLTVVSGSSSQGTPQQTAHGFFVLGMEHIGSGPDHLLFVLALLLLVMRANRNEPPRVVASTMGWTVTAFTVAHSLTLAGSVLGWVRVPSAPVEVAIALSVLLLAVELAREGPERTLTASYPWAVAFAFGLLHGFGFAGALRNVGLPESAIGRTLFLFNLGVEAGQLTFLVALAGVWWLVRRLAPVTLRRGDALRGSFEWLAAYGIGVAAVFWCLQRMWWA